MPATALERDTGVSAADLERMYAQIQDHLARHAPKPQKRGITLPPVDQLIQQAGIATGPAPAPPRRAPWRRKKQPQVTVADHLDAVATVIATYGWAQGALQRGSAVCLRGAQILLVQTGHTPAAVADEAAELLHASTGGRSIWEWQDSKYRSRDQVVGLVRSAAAHARKAGR